MGDLRADGFDSYLTSVGGSGLGVLSPYGNGDGLAPATPPDTPAEAPADGAPDAQANNTRQPLRATFENKAYMELSSWADAQGRWLYV